MGLSEMTQGKNFKLFMARLYGWGASVVIVGALFKIQHYSGAGLMLCIGLSTEAIIFFFSAFEPPHEGQSLAAAALAGCAALMLPADRVRPNRRIRRPPAPDGTRSWCRLAARNAGNR